LRGFSLDAGLSNAGPALNRQPEVSYLPSQNRVSQTVRLTRLHFKSDPEIGGILHGVLPFSMRAQAKYNWPARRVNSGAAPFPPGPIRHTRRAARPAMIANPSRIKRPRQTGPAEAANPVGVFFRRGVRGGFAGSVHYGCNKSWRKRE
jgi:hypothetical protein